jgi:hypothetical protein
MATAKTLERSTRRSRVRVGLFGLVLLVGGWAQLKADVRSKIVGTGRIAGNADTFNGALGAPTLALLQAYDAVLVFSDAPFADANALGDA